MDAPDPRTPRAGLPLALASNDLLCGRLRREETMASFVENQWLATEICCNCGMLFAMPADVQRRRREDHKSFFCPAGHGQHYTGPTEADKLRREVEREREVREAAETRAGKAEQNLAQVARAHRKMRERVMNGVCPCCNRSFGNLREHMKTEHADFGGARTLLELRQAFGMTQAAVANEAGVPQPVVSAFERGKPVSRQASERLQAWLDMQAA